MNSAKIIFEIITELKKTKNENKKAELEKLIPFYFDYNKLEDAEKEFQKIKDKYNEKENFKKSS